MHNLSTDGAISGGVSIAKRLFANFILSDYSQSNIYFGNISSLRYILSTYEQDDSKLLDAINTTLTSMYNRYFTNVEVTSVLSDTERAIKIISIDITMRYNGEIIELNEVVDLKHLNNLILSKA